LLPQSELIGVEKSREVFRRADFSKFQAVHLALDARNDAHVIFVSFNVMQH